MFRPFSSSNRRKNAQTPYLKNTPSNFFFPSRTTGPVSRGLARLRLGLSVDLPAVVAASRPQQAPLLAIPGRRPPARSPPRASSGTPPASLRGRPTAGSPWTRTWAPHLKAWWGASTISGGALPSSPSAHTAAQQCLIDIKVYFPPLLALESIPCLLPNSIPKQISQSSRFTVQCSSSSITGSRTVKWNNL
jgi:hypothetical protein